MNLDEEIEILKQAEKYRTQAEANLKKGRGGRGDDWTNKHYLQGILHSNLALYEQNKILEGRLKEIIVELSGLARGAGI